jgi:aryl-alcohol dehydrogenase-like predicted oxidoreductase
VDKIISSKVSIGTVQFGSAYGVSNIIGKTQPYEVRNILDLSYKNGISMLDTAPLYGDSETVLGNVLTGINWKIITKTPQFTDIRITNKHTKILKKSFMRSLSKLNSDSVYGLMVHNGDDLLKSGGDLLFKEMCCLRSEKLVKKIGVSVYNPEQARNLIERFDIDLIQLPINLFDQSFIKTDLLQFIKSRRIEIHARSVFLQGLLLMDIKSIPAYFSPLISKFKELDILLESNSITRFDAALAFVFGLNEVDNIVIGLNTIDQLRRLLTFLEKPVTSLDFSKFSIDDEKYINPSMWLI